MTRATPATTIQSSNLAAFLRSYRAIILNRTHIAFNLGEVFIFGHFQIVFRLKIQPEARSGLEIAAQVQRGVGRDAAPLRHNVRDARYRHAQIQRQLVHAQPVADVEVKCPKLIFLSRDG